MFTHTIQKLAIKHSKLHEAFFFFGAIMLE